ncbi:MAG: prepilin-type N-terminal cleavage/methylation domain-containing protein [Caldisericia bacterium]|jgi:prepilin-type N-terminal cleavage/methylation domain-containing protein|nr:prepilin-type N-terminal cleavage/methylation domain-containing protein [Caldisericia bacterium]
MKRLFGKKGFTLIELVLVMVLLAALAAVIYPKYLDLRDDAHKAQDQAIIGAWRSGVHIYFARHKSFPATDTDLEGCLDGGLPSGWTVQDNNGTFTISCNGLPSDTTKKAIWIYDPQNGTFTYDSQNSGHGF